MYSKAVIDSGPLFDALVLNYDERNAREYGRSRRFTSKVHEVLKGSNAQREFLNSLASIREKLTTSHVIAELYGLEKRILKLRDPDHQEFWRISIDLLMQWGIDETLIKLLDLASHDSLRTCLHRIGVTDTGLIDLAARHGCVLITQDERTLCVEASKRHVECVRVNQLVLQA